MKKTLSLVLGVAFFLILMTAAYAQQAKEEEVPMRKEVVRLKYVSAAAVRPLLYTYIGRGGHIQSNESIPDVITISDTPENVEKILAAISEIDIKPADLLFTVQLVLGSETDDTTDPNLQRDPIIGELRQLLRYKGYTLLDTSLLRAIDEMPSEVVMGRKADFELFLRPVVAREEPQDLIKIELRLRHHALEVGKDAEGNEVTYRQNKDLIRSFLNIKSGDRTVVGVSKLDGGDKGLILIISGKVVE